jgi:hypothetical protein
MFAIAVLRIFHFYGILGTGGSASGTAVSESEHYSLPVVSIPKRFWRFINI